MIVPVQCNFSVVVLHRYTHIIKVCGLCDEIILCFNDCIFKRIVNVSSSKISFHLHLYPIYLYDIVKNLHITGPLLTLLLLFKQDD